jgi:hypothetical protein
MLKRTILLLGVLGLAIGMPYVVSNKDNLLSSFGSKGDAASSPTAMLASGEIAAAKSPDGPGSLLFPSKTPLEGPHANRLEEVIRMDVTKEWVFARWPRKSTAVAHADWFGIRVPLVTGTNINDLAGSLTYYFDASGLVQHITFRGRTGDTKRLVALVTRYFRLEHQSPEVAGEQLYQVRWNGRVQSELRTRPAPVLWSSSPHTSFKVEMELARPGSGRYLPPRPVPLPATG